MNSIGGFGSSLNLGLGAFWNCDEASGDLIDVLGATNLTANGAPGSAAGIVNTGRLCDATPKYFNRASSAATNTDGTSFSASGWVYSTDAGDFATRQRIIGNWASGSLGGFYLWVEKVAGIRKVVFATQAAGVESDLSITIGGLLTNEWMWWYFNWDASTATKFLRTWSTTEGAQSASAVGATPPDANDTTVSFALGAFRTGAEAWLGRIDATGIWPKRSLNSTEQAMLWNNGSGLQPPF